MSKRSIKYRAWHKKHKQMVSWEILEKFFDGKGFMVMEQVKPSDNALSALITTPYTTYMPPKNLFPDPAFEFMQYTEFNDLNGREIYEGDIVVCRKNHPGFHVVIWGDGHFTFDQGVYLLTRNQIEFEQMEVIGNIYQNPELIPKKGRL